MQDDETKEQSGHNQKQENKKILEFKSIVHNFNFNVQKLKILEQKLRSIVELLASGDILMFHIREIVDYLRLVVVRLFDLSATAQIQLNIEGKEVMVEAIVSIGQCLLVIRSKRGEGGPVSNYKVFAIADQLEQYLSTKSESLLQKYKIISQQQVNSINQKLEISHNLMITLCLASKNNHFSPTTQTKITALLWKYHQNINKSFAEILKNLLQSKYSFTAVLDQLSNKKFPHYRQFFIKVANSKCRLTSNVSIPQLSFVYSLNQYQFSDVYSLLTQEDFLDQNRMESKMCAILNSGGGYLLIGFSSSKGGCVADGMSLSKTRKQQLHKQIRKCFEYIQPKQYCSITIHFLPILPNPLSKQQGASNRQIGRVFLQSKQKKVFYCSEKKGLHFKAYRFKKNTITAIKQKQIYSEILKHKENRHVEQPSSPLCMIPPKLEVQIGKNTPVFELLLTQVPIENTDQNNLDYLKFIREAQDQFHSVNLVNKAYWIIGHQDAYLTIFKLLKDINPNFQIDVKELTNYIQFRISNVQVNTSPHKKLIKFIQHQYVESTMEATIKVYKSTQPLNQKGSKYKFNAVNAKKFNIQNNYIYWQVPNILIVFLIQAISLEQNTQIRFTYISKQQFIEGKNNKLLIQSDSLNINSISD